VATTPSTLAQGAGHDWQMSAVQARARRTFSRRRLLLGAAATVALSRLPSRTALAAAANRPQLGPAQEFSFDALSREAEASAGNPYAPQAPLPQKILEQIDYEALGKIHFDPDCALFRDGPGAYPVTFFHPGRLSPTVVRMFALSGAAPHQLAHEVGYEPRCFRMPSDSPAIGLRGAGYAGFRFQESRLGDQRALDWRKNDWVAFLGAAYFRAIGELYQYGISARGIAVNVAVAGRAEEFPDFTRFYFEPPTPGAHEVTVYALLNGPSIAGAYRFVMHREKSVIMEVEARLFLRHDIVQLGIAPASSMFWFSETLKPSGIDWRPEVHDSDGLALWTGSGEHIWRPLNAPPRTSASAFADRNPRGFGLLQRDRAFDHYLDGVHYERRPSLWVEPLEEWGAGSVQLIENPTDDEIQDNIVAMWVPQQPTLAGTRLNVRYRLHWSADEPYPTPLARCVATRRGRGGQPGRPRPAGVEKFMVEFLGGPLAQLPFGVIPEAVLSAPSGAFSYVFTEAVPDGVPGHWRAQFDFTPAGKEIIDLRLFLRLGAQTLSETWLYQYYPVDHG
jgi:periplasmic glucans biosynthesis protein